VLWRCWLGDRKGIWPVKRWMLVCSHDDLTGTLHGLQLQLSPPFPSSLASMKPANAGSPGKKAVKTERERERSCLQWRQTCRRCRQDASFPRRQPAQRISPVRWTSPARQWYDCCRSPSNQTTHTVSNSFSLEYYTVCSQMKGSVKELNILIYFFFLPITQSSSVSDVLLVEGECQILVFKILLVCGLVY